MGGSARAAADSTRNAARRGRRDYLRGPILGANSASEANAGHVRQPDKLLKIAQVEATEMA